mmetsp:Transcript_22920/g.26949  ORF Transcript_22920/g.26949 Transcript_22920/m.26949 type:complete len:165 (-) Transcript_22920:281-775(-)|eukprot:CAMPEP_0114358480 /NCGR_PEP_ID=MMETSP0101-20121206/22334_1 /TAXON_ID=38822 ORGANISM="Pteridomonas danica, Strain PT" /NCGR_SAMPLE_ID=MMETSP0101 /ASSEMBLY_ACC=CAM_ASM_000211 /LENGTH=164 /DNA_ID=CAMNT_0001501615 /DNA_START=58 /DNA_END=552 /DNA_ORIENTATION=+
MSSSIAQQLKDNLQERLIKAKEKVEWDRTHPPKGDFGDKNNSHSTCPASFHRQADAYVRGKPVEELRDGHEIQDWPRVMAFKEDANKHPLAVAMSKKKQATLLKHDWDVSTLGTYAPHELAKERVRNHHRHRHNPDLQRSIICKKSRNTILAELTPRGRDDDEK